MRLEHSVINMITPWSQFYQHVVFDVLPRLALALPVLKDYEDNTESLESSSADPATVMLLITETSDAVVDLIAAYV